MPRFGRPPINYPFSTGVSIFFFWTVSCSLSPDDHGRGRFNFQLGVFQKVQVGIQLDKLLCTDNMCMNICEVRWRCTAAAVAVALLLYGAGALKVQRKCGLESSRLLCSGWCAHIIRTRAYTQKHRSYLSQKKELEVWLLLYHVWPPQRQNLSLWCYTSTQHRTA